MLGTWSAQQPAFRGGGSIGGPIPTPQGFNRPVFFPYSFNRTSSGTVTTDYSHRAFAPTPRDGDPNTVTYYVSPTGSNSNTGLTPAQAVRAINDAITKGNAQSLPYNVLIAPGIYNRNNSPTGAGGTVRPNKSMSMIATGPGVVTGFFDDTVYTLDEGTTYRATRAGARRVINLLVQDGDGGYPDITFAASLADCRATPGTWWTDNTTVYINRLDGLAVTNVNTRLFLIVGSNPVLGMTTSGNMHVEGIEFQGAHPCLLTGNTTGRFSAHRCRFRYSSGDTDQIGPLVGYRNGFSANGIEAAAVTECDGSYNQADGFSTRMASGIATFMFTMDCRGLNNGMPRSSSNNGITGHDGCVTIDVRGFYRNNAGGQVAFVHAGTQYWGMDVECQLSRGDQIYGGLVPPTDFLVDQDTPQMWLDNCRSSQTQYSRYARQSGIIRFRGGSYAGQDFIGEQGQIVPYDYQTMQPVTFQGQPVTSNNQPVMTGV